MSPKIAIRVYFLIFRNNKTFDLFFKKVSSLQYKKKHIFL